jgi:hypothetical protein
MSVSLPRGAPVLRTEPARPESFAARDALDPEESLR